MSNCNDTKKLSNSALFNEPAFWSRLGFTLDPTRLDSAGHPRFYDENFSVAQKSIAAFEQSGVKIHTCVLHNGWVGSDRYDYAAVDQTLASLFQEHPKIFYLPRIKLNVPIEWALANPEELFVCWNGPRDREGIMRVANKMEKYWATFGWSGDTPDYESRVGLQSFSSAKWKENAGQALVRLLAHLENGPYADRIVGYHIAFGACGESATWGAYNKRTALKGDFGISHRRAFHDWCIRRYGSLEQLREAWGRPDLTYETFSVPSPYEMEPDNTTLEAFFRADRKMRHCIDYSVFCSQMTADAIEHFGKIVKEHTANKPVGAFYGYLFCENPASAGHLAIDQLLDSPYVDFLISPAMYYRREVGWPGGEQSPSQSVARKKFWFDELDNPTHLAKPGSSWATANMDETRTVFWREAAKNLSQGNQNFYWMDLHGGWFDDVQIMDEIAKLCQLNQSIRNTPWQSVSEILYVIDDKSLAVASESYGFINGHNGGVLCELSTELKLTGTPVDTYRLKDLADLPLAQYKLIVFGNAFLFEAGQWESIKLRIPKTSTLVWNYAAGICNPEFGWDNVRKVTGFAVEPCPASAANGSTQLSQATDKSGPRPGGNNCEYKGYDIVRDFPLIRIVPGPGQTVMDTYSDGGIMVAMRNDSEGQRNILCAYPSMKAQELREIALQAGCHMYAPLNCTVYADNRFVGVFSKDEIHDRLNLKMESSICEVLSETTYAKATSVQLDLPAKGAAFFRICL